jgi:hypothetical protein
MSNDSSTFCTLSRTIHTPILPSSSPCACAMMSSGLMMRRSAQRMCTRAATCAHTHSLSLSHTHSLSHSVLHTTPYSLSVSARALSTSATEVKTVTATHRRSALDLSRVYVGQTLDNIDEITGLYAYICVCVCICVCGVDTRQHRRDHWCVCIYICVCV